MLDPVLYPWLFRSLHYFDRLRSFLRRGNPQKQTADSNLAAFYEKIWRDAAAQVGAEIQSLGHGVLEIHLHDRLTRVMQNTTALDDLATHCLVRTKPVVHDLLADQGLPIPRHVVFTLDSLPRATSFLQEAASPCVLKPATGTGGGLGVTTGIRTCWQLTRAAWATAPHSRDLLLEVTVAGDNYRLLYLDGQLLDVVRREPPTVTADGASTVFELVQAVNKVRLERGAEHAHVPLSLNWDMRQTLADQDLSFSFVPAKGMVVRLKTAINENGAADNVSANNVLCDSIIADCATAARVTGVRLAGVDVITPDPTAPLREAGGVILEVNSPPGYYWHYCKQGGSFPVAVHVLESLLYQEVR